MQILVLPSHRRQAQRLWLEVLKRHNAESLLVLYPPYRELTPLLATIAAAGAGRSPLGNPHPVLNIASTVYASEATDLGMLAGLAGIPSFLFRQADPEALQPEFVSALISTGTAYTNPYTGNPAGITQIAGILTDWRRIFQRNRNISACIGVAPWKRRRIAQLLHNGETPPRFYRNPNAAANHAAKTGGAVAAWATRLPSNLPAQLQSQNIPLIRMEDGFIRSLGLGSRLLPPASIITDRQGIFLNPDHPSDLETMLANTEFSNPILARARRLIQLLVLNEISKYGAAGKPPQLQAGQAQRIILVPGQVADDLSVRLGATGAIRTNTELLQAVRLRNPDAFIVYRPHPDVLAGHRSGAIPNPVTSGLADQLVAGGSIAALIAHTHEVHTMTSLAGFEALLRGRTVQCYGKPFYAGWGLTIDHLPIPNRRRRLAVEELAAAALILYPHYIDPATGLPCGPETLIARLSQPELWRPSLLMHLRRLQGSCRRLVTHWA